MGTTYVSEDELDEYLAAPDCPQCGSDNVELLDSYPDGMGGTVRVWICRVCGHTWTE